VKPLAHPDTHHLQAAHGWIELGNRVEASAELEQITPSLLAHPDVLEVRWLIHERAKDWQTCLDLATAIVLADPDRPFGWIHRSYALHELKQTAKAWDELLPAVKKFPGEWLVRYNLACYTCRLGKLDDARSWLEKAIELGDRQTIKRMALDDPDLQMIWTGF
jgi:tetratricopeptide (TPR) repeat protein